MHFFQMGSCTPLRWDHECTVGDGDQPIMSPSRVSADITNVPPHSTSQEAQSAIISTQHLSFEMSCAQLNNNIMCYEQALEFSEDVQVGHWVCCTGNRRGRCSREGV